MDALGSPERFGYEWARYSEILPESREQLQRWLGPVALESFSGRSVLDAGCGMGRNPYWMLRAGAARVVACDLDPGSLEAARRNLASFQNAEVRRCSVYDLDPTTVGLFDRVTCIGVLHHLADPALALSKLFACVAPRGDLIVWCYGREGNERWLPWIEAARAVGSRLPLPATHALASLGSVALWPVIRALPWRTDYFRRMGKLSYRNFRSIVFDQMIPRIANYWTREEMRALAARLPGEATLTQVQGNSWNLVVRRAT